MFARKKTADVQTSLQRFCDLHRDAASRAKHFRLAIELLSVQDKCQLVDDFNFEIFHLIDLLLLHPDLCADAQLVYDAESALWTLEQVLCYAPELVGKGWQRNAIESILKRALLPRNLMAVRKIAIRLFLIWYQTLAVYGNTNRSLDIVFQCCLPFFPLQNRQSSEQILQAYCESAHISSITLNGGGFEPGPLKVTPIIVDNGAGGTISTGGATSNENMGVRERAQILQIYLDKFLEYCCRETMKIEWNDESKRLNCAKFVLDRVILFYISEVFPDLETNGVDIFGGWECDEEPAPLLDTADPVVIARYWLIRWLVNIAMAPMTETPTPGLLLYRQALLSSQKATNALLTLMREAMQLPLACANVVHKAVALARCWLLQRNVPPFVDSGAVKLEAWNVLLIHTLLSFFRSAYLRSTGERLSSAVSLTRSILAALADLANPAVGALPRALPTVVWTELMRRLAESVRAIVERTDAFASATAGVFTRTILSIAVYVRVIREVDLDDRMWDDVWMIFRTAVWTQVVEQWSKFVESMTRALILNLFAIDTGQFESSGSVCPETSSTGSSSTRRHASGRVSVVDRITAAAANAAAGGGAPPPADSENGSIAGGEGGMPDDDPSVQQHVTGSGSVVGSSSDVGERSSQRDFQSIVQSTGNVYLWLRSWMRVVSLVDITSENGGTAARKSINIENNNGSNKIRNNSEDAVKVGAGAFSHQREAVQALSRAMDTLLRCACADALVHWLAVRLLHHRRLVNEQPHAIAPLCAVLARSSYAGTAGNALPSVFRAHILLSLRVCLVGNTIGNLMRKEAARKSESYMIVEKRNAQEQEKEEEEVDSAAQLVLEQMPQMSVEDLVVLSPETITTLQKLLKSSAFSARVVRVAALLCSNHAEVEKILVALLEDNNVDFDPASLVLCVNTLCLVILERVDESLFTHLSVSIARHKQARMLLPIFCVNLLFLAQIGLGEPLMRLICRAIVDASADISSEESPFIDRLVNDLKWHFCALWTRKIVSISDSANYGRTRALFECLQRKNDAFFEGVLLQLAEQFPLPNFTISKWNSMPNTLTSNAGQTTTEANLGNFIDSDDAILSFEKSDNSNFLWSRTVVGRHCYAVGTLDVDTDEESPVNAWLASVVSRNPNGTNMPEQMPMHTSAGQANPLKELPHPKPHSPNEPLNSSRAASAQHVDYSADVTEMLRLIRASRLEPELLPAASHGKLSIAGFASAINLPGGDSDVENVAAARSMRTCFAWRQFLAGFALVNRARDVPANFHRELRHLDATMSREAHKVAVIYIGLDQEDKQSILSNTAASEAFEAFLHGLGWWITVGASDFHGYTGGLPGGQCAPYYATANTELIFHVSTRLQGDAHQKMKHLGNDEVHVVWSENGGRAYRREILATRFCDVLIVLYPISATLIRVHMETQNPALMFGPLFDGAFIHVKQAANLVRETVLNASRAYRNARLDCERPNKLRERVFHNTKAQFRHLSLVDAIVRLYAPTPN